MTNVFIIDKLRDHIKSQNYKGYDPYDALNSFIPFNKFGHIVQVLAVQFFVRCPINIRRLIGIKREYSMKSIGLMLHALSIYYSYNKDISIRKEMDYLFLILKTKRRNENGFVGAYWAVHYPIAWKTWERPRFDPSAVLAAVIFEGVFEYYKITNNEEAKLLLLEIGNFIIHCVPIIENEYGKCYSYTTRKKEVVFNANMYVAEIFSKLYHLTDNSKYKNEAESCINFNLHYQRLDGSWGYRRNLETGIERNQIDFHQGFILNSLFESIKYLNITNSQLYISSLKRGLNFYLRRQFTEEGKGFWRYPNLYPIDIHNQAVGIWIFSKLGRELKDVDCVNFADKIFDWTIDHLYNKNKGYFYYQYRRIFTNKIDYIRWNQSWMLLALTNYFKNLKYNDK